MLGEQDIEDRFGFHKAAIEDAASAKEVHQELRHGFKLFAKVLNELLPEDSEAAKRYKELAFDSLENASMWSHKGVVYTVSSEGE